MTPAAFLLCPGRGSYAKPELGWLHARRAQDPGGVGELVDRLSELQRQLDPDAPSFVELDTAGEFRPARHLPGRHASPLIFACTLADAIRARRETTPVLVGGNSLGFYTALVVAGALPVEQGFRLVTVMARLQEELAPPGGQVLWTLLDDDWQPVAARVELLQRLLVEIGDEVAVSIRLGGHVVLGGTESGVETLLARLPKVKLGEREFPFRLAFHGPFHTPLLAPVAARAVRELDDLGFRRPSVPLIDGRGYVWSPLWADRDALRAYTLQTQVTETFDFTTMVRTALLEYAPEVVELLAPGTSLRAPVGHVEKAIDDGGTPLPSILFPRPLPVS